MTKVPFCYEFVGMRESGKSTLVCNLLTKVVVPANMFDVMILCSPSAHQPMWDLIPWTERINTWPKAEAKILALIEAGRRMREKADDPDDVPQIFILCDDFISDKDFQKSEAWVKVATYGRHSNVSGMSLSQSNVGNAKTVRRNCECVALWPLGNDDLYTNYRELGLYDIEWDLFRTVCQAIWDKHPAQFVWVNKRAPPGCRIFSNFKRVRYSVVEQPKSRGVKRPREDISGAPADLAPPSSHPRLSS